MLNSFSFKRLFQLMHNDFYLNRKLIGIASLTIAGLLLFYNLIAPNNILYVNQYPAGYFNLLFFGGIWISSHAFRGIHDDRFRHFFLTLPASSLEKFLSRFIATAVIYPLALLVLYTGFYWIIGLLNLVFFHTIRFIDLPFLSMTWQMIGIYIVIQSFFLLGSIYFKKHAIIKTILALSVIGIILSLFVIMVSRMWFSQLMLNQMFWIPDFSQVGASVWGLTKMIFWILLAPICWVTAYVRLTETEAQ